MKVNFFSGLFGGFKRKTVAVFFSDSYYCPCQKTYDLAKECKNAEPVLIKNTVSKESESKLTVVNSQKNIMVYAHGDEKGQHFFYKRLDNKTERHVVIQADWWKQLEMDKRNIYFHICNGATILTHNAKLRNLFPSWVSYNRPVNGFYSSNESIIQLNRKFLDAVAAEVKKKQTTVALKSAVEGAYYSIKGDLQEISQSFPGTIQSVPGYGAIISAVGRNVRALTCS